MATMQISAANFAQTARVSPTCRSDVGLRGRGSLNHALPSGTGAQVVDGVAHAGKRASGHAAAPPAVAEDDERPFLGPQFGCAHLDLVVGNIDGTLDAVGLELTGRAHVDQQRTLCDECPRLCTRHPFGRRQSCAGGRRSRGHRRT